MALKPGEGPRALRFHDLSRRAKRVVGRSDAVLHRFGEAKPSRNGCIVVRPQPAGAMPLQLLRSIGAFALFCFHIALLQTFHFPGAGKMRPSALSSFPRPRVSKPCRNDFLSKKKTGFHDLSFPTKRIAKIKGERKIIGKKEKTYFIKNILLYTIPFTNISSNRILYLLPQEENRTYISPSSSTSPVMVTQW